MELSELQKNLLNQYQQGLPLSPAPYATMADALNVEEDDVIEALKGLEDEKVLSRVGAVLRPNAAGASTLAAISVAKDQLSKAAAFVNTYREVNHNYEREHEYNLWFVLNADSEERIQNVLCEIEQELDCPSLNLPLQREYHINLGFGLTWN